ncbi:hypothetical protein ACFY36_04285 [Actinoplanes sp. NPDC000266]
MAEIQAGPPGCTLPGGLDPCGDLRLDRQLSLHHHLSLDRRLRSHYRLGHRRLGLHYRLKLDHRLSLDRRLDLRRRLSPRRHIDAHRRLDLNGLIRTTRRRSLRHALTPTSGCRSGRRPTRTRPLPHPLDVVIPDEWGYPLDRIMQPELPAHTRTAMQPAQFQRVAPLKSPPPPLITITPELQHLRRMRRHATPIPNRRYYRPRKEPQLRHAPLFRTPKIENKGWIMPIANGLTIPSKASVTTQFPASEECILVPLMRTLQPPRLNGIPGSWVHEVTGGEVREMAAWRPCRATRYRRSLIGCGTRGLGGKTVGG